MVDFADSFPDAAVLDALGDTITYNGSDIKAIFDMNAERIGDDGYKIERRAEVDVLLSSLPALPQSGDTVVYKTVNYTVAQIEKIDAFYATLSLKKT